MEVIINGVYYEECKILSDPDALNLKFFCDDLQCTITIKDYLLKLLSTLWDEQDCFSGKRPFGNSCWDVDVYAALIAGEFISGTLTEEGYADNYDRDEAHEFVAGLINQLGN